MQKICYDKLLFLQTSYRVEYGKARIGKPSHQTKKYVYVDNFNLLLYNESRGEDHQIYQNATQRRFRRTLAAHMLSIFVT